MAGPTISFLNLARAMKVLALLLFLMPWATVSCSPEALQQSAGAPMAGAPSTDIASPTGLEIAMGDVELKGSPPPSANAPAAPFTEPNMFLIAAAALIALSLAATFLLKGALGALAAIGGLVLAGGALCYTMFVQAPKAVQDYFAALVASEGANAPPINPAELAQMIQVKIEGGFWQVLAVLALAVVLLLVVVVRSRTGTAAAEATPAEPPPPAG